MPIQDDNDPVLKRSTEAVLARLDERTIQIQQELLLLNSNINSRFREVEERLTSQIEELENDIHKNYIRKDQFNPIQKLVYGFVSIIVVVVLGAMLSQVLVKH